MNIADIREKTSQELNELMVNFRKEFVTLTFQKKLGQCSNTSRFSLIRRSIARILTVLNEKRKEGDQNA